MTQQMNWKIVDATELILGRMCSQVAKLALLGEHVLIINAKDAVISGRRNQIIKNILIAREARDLANPNHGPFRNSRPDMYVRQKVRQMLPKNDRGHDAIERVHVYINGIPKVKEEKYKNQEALQLKNASSSRLSHKYHTVADICTNMGWTGGSRDESLQSK